MAYAVHEVTIAGNLKSMYRGVQALGSEVDRLGAIQSGPVLLDEMTIAGG
jgi:PmbA protein